MNCKLNMGLKTLALLAGTAAIGSQAFAANVTLNSDGTETLTFGGQVNAASISSFFDGGSDAYGNGGATPGGPANNVGITFSSVAEFENAGYNGSGLNGGTGRFEHAPNGATGVLYIAPSPTTVTPILDDQSGFSAISLDYALYSNSATYASSVQFYSGLDGSGTLLGTLLLGPATMTTACSSRNDYFCSWNSGSLALTGTAESAVFTGNSRTYTEFSDLTLAPATPVPLPAALWLLVSGVGGLAGFMRRRQAA